MPWDIVYYRQADGRVPVHEFLAACPVKVRARLLAVLDDVAEAPPPQFFGGGRWEAMQARCAASTRSACRFELGGRDVVTRAVQA